MDEEVILLIGRKAYERLRAEAGEDIDCICEALLVLNKRFDIKETKLGYIDMDFILGQKRLHLTLKTKS